MVVFLSATIRSDRCLKPVAVVRVEDLRLPVLILSRLGADLDVAVVHSVSLQLEAVLPRVGDPTRVRVQDAALVTSVLLLDRRRRAQTRVVVIEDIADAFPTALVLRKTADLVCCPFATASVLVERRNRALVLVLECLTYAVFHTARTVRRRHHQALTSIRGGSRRLVEVEDALWLLWVIPHVLVTHL